MKRPVDPQAKLRQATFAWTVVLSLLLAWIGAQPRPADFQTYSTSASLAAAAVPKHVATLAAAGKIHRAPEFRPGSNPEIAVLVSYVSDDSIGLELSVTHCAQDDPCGESSRSVPEPRAPPQI